jgi:predicted house-cleaning noncanonical NTP pyrophosphatase (MazG superfamily)
VTDYDKLVRDRIPEIIEATGRTCVLRTLSTEEFPDRLREKLTEEVDEYLASGEVGEMADILEVVAALGQFHGVSAEDLENLRGKKLAERGGFERKLLLLRVDD